MEDYGFHENGSLLLKILDYGIHATISYTMDDDKDGVFMILDLDVLKALLYRYVLYIR